MEALNSLDNRLTGTLNGYFAVINYPHMWTGSFRVMPVELFNIGIIFFNTPEQAQ